MEGVAYCTKCDSEHQRPVGRRSELFQAMAASLQSDNHDDTSVTTLGQNLENPQPGTSAQTQSVNQEMENDVLLAELRALASRMNRFEAEFNHSQSDTRTSTPRRRKKARKNQGSSHFRADLQLSLNESHILGTVTSAPNIAIATTSAVMVNAGSGATSTESRTTITTASMVRPSSSTVPITSVPTATWSVRMQMSPIGVPVVSHSVSPTITGMSVPAIGQGFMANRHTAIGAQQQLAGNILWWQSYPSGTKNSDI